MASRRTLNQRLDRLRDELEASSSLSAADRKRLETLLRDVRDHAEGEGDQHEPQSLADRLHEATTQFEESHPNLTLAIGAVADTLSRMGI